MTTHRKDDIGPFEIPQDTLPLGVAWYATSPAGHTYRVAYEVAEVLHEKGGWVLVCRSEPWPE